MSSPYGAIPGQRPLINEEFKAQPAPEQVAGCPMCHKADQLVIDVPTLTHYRIQAFYVGTTSAEYVKGDEVGYTESQREDIAAIRCMNCQWKFTGELPLSKLVPL